MCGRSWITKSGGSFPLGEGTKGQFTVSNTAPFVNSFVEGLLLIYFWRKRTVLDLNGISSPLKRSRRMY